MYVERSASAIAKVRLLDACVSSKPDDVTRAIRLRRSFVEQAAASPPSAAGGLSPGETSVDRTPTGCSFNKLVMSGVLARISSGDRRFGECP
jgi:hypothetical protein